MRSALADSQVAAGESDEFTAALMRFHDALGTASGNPALAAGQRALGMSRREHYAGKTTPDTIVRTLRIHEDILASIEAGHGERARRLVVDHLTAVARRLYA